MSRAHLTLLLSLLVATLALPVSAQTPTDSVTSDSVASAAPKKKSRFGGMMDKAKKVATNKTIQDAAKGAAAGVACTVVPGAAVVSAATGAGPCANAGLGALMSGGGIKTAATTMASGAASGAAAKAMGKMSGTSGAAAAGALGAVGGQGGLSKAAAAAAASAMMPKGGAAVAGMAGNAAAMAAAQAAAAQMMSGMPGGTPAKKGSKVKSAPGVDGASMAEAMAAMGGMGAAMGTAGGKALPTVDFRELKGLLPESLRGLNRTEATGEKQGAMGMNISSAVGRYSSEDGGKSVTLTITDMGGMAGLGGMAAYAWASTEVDRESDGGYEKTTTFKGYKALEKYNKQSRSGELSVIVGERFIVEADGNSVDLDAIKSALGSVDLKKLSGMKGQGAK